ncbi:MAG: cytochrome P450, partial [Myxococcaceae bacterium]
HPEIEERLVREINTLTQGQPVTAEHLPQLRYARQVMQEGMRLYPPAWILGRAAIEDDQVAGYQVPSGGNVIISPYLLHRDPRFWESPDHFDPERFSPEAEKTRARFSYLPFGGGPRICIGNEFALMEAQLILSAIVQRYWLRLVPGQKIELEPTITLRPRDGIRVTTHQRPLTAIPGDPLINAGATARSRTLSPADGRSSPNTP